MSVRRLAEGPVQPDHFAFSNDNRTWAERTIGLYPEGRQASAVIPLLMRAQDQEGWVTRAAIETVAAMLGMPYIRVLEVATFYTQFLLQPVGTKAHVMVCGTTPCMLHGAEDLRAVCQRVINSEPFATNADGTLSWEEVECLGACVNAPMVMIGHDTYEDLTPKRLEQILVAFAAGEGGSIPPGPQIEREHAAPAGGRTTLTEIFVHRAEPHPEPAVGEPQQALRPGRKFDVGDEAAPAIHSPGEDNGAKVTAARAEHSGEDVDPTLAEPEDGEPNDAMREGATGGESPAAAGVAGSHGDDPLFEAPEGEADDLKRISGIGPMLERQLHALGLTRYSQIAALTDDDVRRLDQRLKFKGRVVRDDWIGQAAALASGKEAR